MLTSLVQAQVTLSEKERWLQTVRSYDEFPLYDDTSRMGNIHRLLNCSSDEEYFNYAHDSSVILRYIGFRAVLKQNSDRAFELVNDYKFDTTEIIFRVPCTIYEDYEYNMLLFSEYYAYIYYTYKEGESCCDLMGQFWSSGTKDIDKFKRKRKQLFDFLKKNSLTEAVDKMKAFDQMMKE